MCLTRATHCRPAVLVDFLDVGAPTSERMAAMSPPAYAAALNLAPHLFQYAGGDPLDPPCLDLPAALLVVGENERPLQ